VRLAPLDRKLLRDLAQVRGQMAAISLVIGAGVAMFVLMLSTFDSLDLTKRTYYEHTRFGDVFASLKRAPERVAGEIARIPGVAEVQTRVVVDVTLDVADTPEPASGRLISLPASGRPALNDVFLREGRWISPESTDEVLASESFARVHGLEPGDTVAAVINGRRRVLHIVGLALSPEYVYSIKPGQLLPDDRLFGVFWMARRPLAAAFAMEGAFNDVSLSLMRGASAQEVIDRLDRILRPYGGLGSIPRSLQLSNWYLESELSSLRGIGAIVPLIFLAVAAFLLNVVLSRIVSVQREQIAALKALGYGNAAVGWHYVKWGLAVAVLGGATGIAAGAWLGHGMTQMYTSFFHFPILRYHLPGAVLAEAAAVSAAGAVLGALGAVRRAVVLPPAEAMRPEPPTAYRPSLVERAGLRRVLSQPGRIIARNLQRRPARTALSVVGIAFGGALLIVGSFSWDAVETMTDVQFNVAQRYDAMLSFVEPRSASALYDLERLPGVMAVERYRAVPVRLRFGRRSRTTAITGLPAQGRLDRVVDEVAKRAVTLPPTGLVLDDKLAALLGAGVGDRVTVEVLEGRRQVREVVVSALVREYMGTSAYMDIDALHRLLDEGGSLSGAFLRIDHARLDELYSRLKRTPAVAGVSLKEATLESFERTMGETIGMVRTVTVLFAAIIAFGVVYNAARISLSERARELATLRVVGFWRSEISYILLGELALVTLAAVPLGLVLGYLLSAATVHAYDTEVYRLPLVIFPRTYALSAITVLVAAGVSALVVHRKLDRLDLVAVLKSRE
jgi:putative ABC transport system permease protein